MECNNDMNSMIDVAKVADLVLLMIDASFGFEMVSKYPTESESMETKIDLLCVCLL